MKINKFRVLVLDDKQQVLDSLYDWIENKMSIGTEEFVVELIRLNVEVIEAKGEHHITEKTMKNLNELCFVPFNLILLDFGFVPPGFKTDYEVSRMHEENPQISKRNFIEKLVLNPSHIVNEANKDKSNYKNIKKNFIDFDRNIYVYTFISSKLEQDYTNADVRMNVTNRQFPKAKIKVLDTRKELFNNEKFDDRYDLEYYAFLISKFLSKIIQLEIAEFLLGSSSAIKQKFNRIKKSNRLLAFSIILPSLIAGIFLPILYTSLSEGKFVLAFGSIIVLIIILVTFLILARYVEKQQEKWLK